ncbi:uncharacterized protein LOC141910388 [Tubulanus polymorphus]|uniref:uncharacterized protein LOC141910388 n=1 Tax=Tubulanus polymorphus TaxID=672921 RepID=UPI003DA5C183
MDDDKRLLSVGLVCIDVLAYCEQFPAEDTDTRVKGMKWTRGGNASNNCTVWSLLGERCEFFGSIPFCSQTRFIEEDFDKYHISHENCIRHAGCDFSICCGIINSTNGSRTFVYDDRSQPEVKFEEFVEKIDLKSGKYKWIHFQGRPAENDILKMLQHVDEWNKTASINERIKTSVEIEVDRDSLVVLLDAADYVFISKEYAIHKGFSSPEYALAGFAEKVRSGAAVICPWGEKGAFARDCDGAEYESKAFVPDAVVDTLGAGDTFIAAVISRLSRADDLRESIRYGCRIAGYKCGHVGFDRIRDVLYLRVLSVAQEYPDEDKSLRASEIKIVRGGNASNNCTVWSLLGEKCEYFGTIATSAETSFIIEDFHKYGIVCDNCVYHENCQFPLSIGMISSDTGSRTIVHSNRTLPEVTHAEFKSRIDLASGRYSWIHFEGRPAEEEISHMLKSIDEFNRTQPDEKRITTSVELEKTRHKLGMVLDKADFVFISKEHAAFRGYQTADEAIDGFAEQIRDGACLVCPWGDQGAYCVDSDGRRFRVAAHKPEKLVDTLGAGDTFVAATISRLHRGQSFHQAVTFGCHVAGFKCGIVGFDRIEEHKT